MNSSSEGSGSENEDSGSDQDGSDQDTASEPGSQHTTPDNVSDEELEHGEITSKEDRNDLNKTEREPILGRPNHRRDNLFLFKDRKK